MFKIAIIGCGRIASTYDDDPKRKYPASHIGAYRRFKELKVSAICDVNELRLNKCSNRWKIRNKYKDYKKLIANENIDILSVCTPAVSHLKIIKEAVKSKTVKAIYCEKPLAGNVKEANEIINLCNKRKIVLQVNFLRRFDEGHIKLKQLIKSNKLGKAQQVTIYYTNGLLNNGSHLIDLALFFIGDVSWVRGWRSINSSHNKADPNIDGILKMKNGTSVLLQACDRNKYLIFEFNALFEKAGFGLKNSGFKLNIAKPKPSKYFSGAKELEITQNSIKTNMPHTMLNGVKHILECIKNNKGSSSSGETALKVLKVTQALRKSVLRDGKKIYIY